MSKTRFMIVATVITISTFVFGLSWAATPQTRFAVLSGGNEVDDAGAAGAGDTNGRGSATILIDSDRGTVCFAIAVTAIGNPVAAHIHRASAGQNGGIVVTLAPPNAGSPGASSGCVTGVARQLLLNIQNNPSGFYVNVHTEDFGAGAIRGQLF
jgi:hypothetical protein